MASTKVQRIMTQPINLIFRFLQSKARIQIWLFEQKDMRIEGRIIGFDEYMNLVLEDAEEINIKKNTRKSLGKDTLERRQHNSDDEHWKVKLLSLGWLALSFLC
uniref:Small nuclear ribonucleoprotein E n=1 Tax=Aegilops tauschii subsp. strangulata TaxID=200361 RepID=A0A453RYS3_AEGTS